MNLINKLKQDVLNYITKNPDVTRSEISQGLKITLEVVEKTTDSLFDEKRLIFKPRNKTFAINPDFVEKIITEYRGSKDQSEKSVLQRRKPYTPNRMQGFKSHNGKVTVFLERRCQARSVTFNKEQLLNMLSSCN